MTESADGLAELEHWFYGPEDGGVSHETSSEAWAKAKEFVENEWEGATPFRLRWKSRGDAAQQTEPDPDFREVAPSSLHDEAAAVLYEAADLVTGDRARSYGDPEESFGEIAYLWRWWLLGRDPATISAVDVASMLGLMKTRRKKAEPGNRDHWVDEAGYAGLGGAIATKRTPT